jgi:hypothetical protein
MPTPLRFAPIMGDPWCFEVFDANCWGRKSVYTRMLRNQNRTQLLVNLAIHQCRHVDTKPHCFKSFQFITHICSSFYVIERRTSLAWFNMYDLCTGSKHDKQLVWKAYSGCSFIAITESIWVFCGHRLLWTRWWTLGFIKDERPFLLSPPTHIFVPFWPRW